MQGKGIIEAFSSGSLPSGKVNDKAIASMQAVGYDLTLHTSKSLNDIPQILYDYVITMGCGDKCPYVQANARENWDIPDPKHMNMDQFNEIRDAIRDKVTHLIETIKTSKNAIK